MTFVESVDYLLDNSSKLVKQIIKEARPYLQALGVLQDRIGRILRAYSELLSIISANTYLVEDERPWKVEKRWRSRAKRRNERSSGRGEVTRLDVLDLFMPILFGLSSTDDHYSVDLSGAR